MPSDVVVEINAKDVGLEKIASGKVREIFKVDDETLLFVATDRISAYDVVLENVGASTPVRDPIRIRHRPTHDPSLIITF